MDPELVVNEFNGYTSTNGKKSNKPSYEADAALSILGAPNHLKDLIFHWSIRKKIARVVNIEKENPKDVAFGTMAAPITKNHAKSIFFSINNIPKSVDIQTQSVIRLKKKLIFCLGLNEKPKLESDWVKNYFDENKMKNRLPKQASNSCFCDSIISILLHSNIYLIDEIIQNNSTAPKYMRFFYRSMTYFGLDPNKITLDFFLPLKPEVDKETRVWYYQSDNAGIEYVIPTTRPELLNIINSEDSSLSQTFVQKMKDFYTEHSTVIDKNNKQDDASAFFNEVVAFGGFEDFLTRDLFFEIHQRVGTSVNYFYYDKTRMPTIKLITPVYISTEKSIDFQKLMDYQINTYEEVEVYKNQPKFYKKLELLLPIEFLAIDVVRSSNGKIKNEYFLYKDKRRLIFQETYEYFIDGVQQEAELCGFLYYNGSHYISYFKTDNGENSTWFRYNDLGGENKLEKKTWNDFKDSFEIQKKSSMVFLRRKR